MTPEEKAHFEKFGMLPKKSLATHMLGKRDEVHSSPPPSTRLQFSSAHTSVCLVVLCLQGRQHFDSAEWAKGLQNKKGPLGKVQNE
jgi:hypothetical protein